MGNQRTGKTSFVFFFSSRRRHTRCLSDWSSDVCSSDLQQQAQSYLNLLSGLRGPADWAKYQQVLGATPGGMRDLVSAAMGQYMPGGGATTGVQPQAASLQTLQQQVAGGGTAQGAQQLGQLPAPNQLAPQAWRNLAPSQQELLLGAYENQGWNKDDVRALLSQSLPRYASNAPQAGTWRLAA